MSDYYRINISIFMKFVLRMCLFIFRIHYNRQSKEILKQDSNVQAKQDRRGSTQRFLLDYF